MHFSFPLWKIVFTGVVVVILLLTEEPQLVPAAIRGHLTFTALEVVWEAAWHRIFPDAPPLLPSTNVAIDMERVGSSVDGTGTLQGEGQSFNAGVTQLAVEASYTGARSGETKLSASVELPNKSSIARCDRLATSESGEFSCTLSNLSLSPGQYFVAVSTDGIERRLTGIQVTTSDLTMQGVKSALTATPPPPASPARTSEPASGCPTNRSSEDASGAYADCDLWNSGSTTNGARTSAPAAASAPAAPPQLVVLQTEGSRGRATAPAFSDRSGYGRYAGHLGYGRQDRGRRRY